MTEHQNRYTRPNFDSLALVTIDTQNDFLDGGPMEIPGTTQVLPAMTRLLQTFRQTRRPIVHIVRLYKTDGSNVDLCRRAQVEDGVRLAAPDDHGSGLAPELLPVPAVELNSQLLLEGGVQQIGPQEVVIFKPRWGAFYKTPLEEHLKSLGVDTLAFCGCNYPNCPRTSIYEAGERDFRLILVTDAISGLYERGAREMANTGVNLMTTQELIDALTTGG